MTSHIHIILTSSHIVTSTTPTSHVVIPVPHTSIKPCVSVIVTSSSSPVTPRTSIITKSRPQLVGWLEPSPTPAPLLVLVLSAHVTTEPSPRSTPAHALVGQNLDPGGVPLEWHVGVVAGLHEDSVLDLGHLTLAH